MQDTSSSIQSSNSVETTGDVRFPDARLSQLYGNIILDLKDKAYVALHPPDSYQVLRSHIICFECRKDLLTHNIGFLNCANCSSHINITCTKDVIIDNISDIIIQHNQLCRGTVGFNVQNGRLLAFCYSLTCTMLRLVPM